MNVEQLHSLALAIRDDLRSTEALKTLRALRDSLQNQVNQPQAVGHQQQVAAARDTLRAATTASESRRFPPLWQHLLGEMRLATLLGPGLGGRVESIFQQNQISPAIALTALNELVEEVERLDTSLTGLLGAFDYLGFGTEDVAPGEAQIGVVIPRNAVQNSLEPFGSELRKLNQTFSVFSEIVLGERDGFRIKAIGSSDLMVFLEAAPAVAACLAVAIERIVNLYKSLLEIRKLRQELEAQKVPVATLAPIDAHANSRMKDGIEPLVNEIIKEFCREKDSGRRHELKAELHSALNGIANRIDAGYNLQVTATPPTPDQAPQEPDDSQEAFARVAAASEAMQFIRLEGKPLLSLPESAAPPATAPETKKPRRSGRTGTTSEGTA